MSALLAIQIAALPPVGGSVEPRQGGFPCRPCRGDFLLPPLPCVDADAAANDRFDLRLTRADLAVVHRTAPSPSTIRKMPRRPGGVTGAKSGKTQ